MSKEINKQNVKNYMEGRKNQLFSMFNITTEGFEEQVKYRMSKCEDCIKEGECPYCGCPTPDRLYASQSCNGGLKFPDIMTDLEWTEYKTQHNINE